MIMTPARRALILLILGAGVLMPLFVGLGIWQLVRWQEHQASNANIQARLDLPPLDLAQPLLPETPQLDYRLGVVRGTYDFSQEIVLKNRAYQSQPGVHVLTPLLLTNSDRTILVDRGWIPYETASAEVRQVYHFPSNEVEVKGLLRLSQSRASALLPADPVVGPGLPRLDAWFWVDLPQIQSQLPYTILPVFLELEQAADPRSLPIAGYELDLTEGPHLNYAFQWFAFAGIALIGPLMYWRQQKRL